MDRGNKILVKTRLTFTNNQMMVILIRNSLHVYHSSIIIEEGSTDGLPSRKIPSLLSLPHPKSCRLNEGIIIIINTQK